MPIIGQKTKRMMVRTYIFTAVKRNGEVFTCTVYFFEKFGDKYKNKKENW